MGSDGAKNLLTMRKAGAHTIGQDQATCIVYGMPMVAFNIGGVIEQLPLNQITDAILRRLIKG
jgi:two-component system chemotaxis response regulator CheB